MEHPQLSCTLRSESMDRVPPIDSVEHVGEPRRRDSDQPVGRRWPDEPAVLQPLGIQRHAKSVMPKNLDQVTSGTSEDVKIARMRIALQGLRTCRARPFMPRRISVRPIASQTRTPEGTAIVAAPARRAHAAALDHQSRRRRGSGICR
jgi:hypothetical protein